MAVYCGDSHVEFRKALQSVFLQTYPAELTNVYLGVDGPVSSEIEEVIAAYQPHLFQVHQNSIRIGLAETLNGLIQLLSNEVYVFRMDADDISRPDRFEKQVQFMLQHPDIDVLGTDLREVDSLGNVLTVRNYPRGTSEIEKYICKGSPVAHPTVCFRRTFFDRFGSYPRQFRTSQDIALWFRAVSRGARITNLPQELYELKVDRALYRRRSIAKAWNEFRIYVDGIRKIHGLTWRYVYPLSRLFFRLLPLPLIELFYRGSWRRVLLNERSDSSSRRL